MEIEETKVMDETYGLHAAPASPTGSEASTTGEPASPTGSEASTTGEPSILPASEASTTGGPATAAVAAPKKVSLGTALSKTTELFIQSKGNGEYQRVDSKEGENIYRMARTKEGECFTLSTNQSGGKTTRRNKKKKRGLKSRAKRRY